MFITKKITKSSNSSAEGGKHTIWSSHSNDQSVVITDHSTVITDQSFGQYRPHSFGFYLSNTSNTTARMTSSLGHLVSGQVLKLNRNVWSIWSTQSPPMTITWSILLLFSDTPCTLQQSIYFTHKRKHGGPHVHGPLVHFETKPNLSLYSFRTELGYVAIKCLMIFSHCCIVYRLKPSLC